MTDQLDLTDLQVLASTERRRWNEYQHAMEELLCRPRGDRATLLAGVEAARQRWAQAADLRQACTEELSRRVLGRRAR